MYIYFFTRVVTELPYSMISSLCNSSRGTFVKRAVERKFVEVYCRYVRTQALSIIIDTVLDKTELSLINCIQILSRGLWFKGPLRFGISKNYFVFQNKFIASTVDSLGLLRIKLGCIQYSIVWYAVVNKIP